MLLIAPIIQDQAGALNQASVSKQAQLDKTCCLLSIMESVDGICEVMNADAKPLHGCFPGNSASADGLTGRQNIYCMNCQRKVEMSPFLQSKNVPLFGISGD
jgi:hypothetical protein